MPNKPAEPSPEVAPMHPDLCDCATCWQAIAEARRRTILKREAEITNLLAVPAVAPRETQTEPNVELLANDIMKIVTRGWDPQGKVPVANYNRIFAEVYTLLLRIRAEGGR